MSSSAASHGDLDLTTDAVPERVLEIIRGWADQVWTIGIEFGTVGMRRGDRVFEITTYRSEQYAPKSRKPDVAYGTSLTDDLSRRDFTVNAMAARLPGHELVDPFGGLQRPEGKVLRTPGRPAGLAQRRSAADPARGQVRRAAGLRRGPGAARGHDRAGAAAAPPKVSAERISAELTKLMLAPLVGGPRRGIELLVDTAVADQVLPEVPKLRLEQDEHFRHKDVYLHSLTVLDQAIALEERYGLDGDLRLRLAALLHDIGKPKTRTRLPGGRVAFHHHEVKGAQMARARLTRPALPVRAWWLTCPGWSSCTCGSTGTARASGRTRRSAVTSGTPGPLLSRLHALTRADCTTRNQAKAQRLARAYDSLEERIAELAEREELASIRPDLDGHEIMRILGIGPGPLVGKAHDYLLELRLEHGPLGPERADSGAAGLGRGRGAGPPAGSPPADG